MSAPPDIHAALDRFVDGELPPGEAERFRQHLEGCPRCQAGLHGRVQLEGLAQDTLAEAGSPGATVIRPARWRVRVAAAVGVALAASLALVIARLGGAGVDPSLWLAEGPQRPLEARLSSPGADRHRPYQLSRGRESAPPPPLPLLARLEEQGKLVAIAESYLARGAPEAARPYLDRALETPEALSARAVMELLAGRPEEALRQATRALALRPQLQPARWNRALALRALGLALGAAAELDAVAAAGEPGWSDEAKQLAAQLRAEVERARREGGAEAEARLLGQRSEEARLRGDLELSRAYREEAALRAPAPAPVRP